MINYAQLNEDNICIGISMLKDNVSYHNMIEIESLDMTVINKKYRGKEIGFTDLDYTKIGKQDSNVTIKMFNYLDEFQSDYTGEIKFKVSEEEFTDTMENGILEFEFINETGKPITIETLNENIRNGVLIIE